MKNIVFMDRVGIVTRQASDAILLELSFPRAEEAVLQPQALARNLVA